MAEPEQQPSPQDQMEELVRKLSEHERELEEVRRTLADKDRQFRTLLAETGTAQEQERNRIAQDLHDSLNQMVFAIAL